MRISLTSANALITDIPGLTDPDYLPGPIVDVSRDAPETGHFVGPTRDEIARIPHWYVVLNPFLNQRMSQQSRLHSHISRIRACDRSSSSRSAAQPDDQFSSTLQYCLLLVCLTLIVSYSAASASRPKCFALKRTSHRLIFCRVSYQTPAKPKQGASPTIPSGGEDQRQVVL
jgi:hypothetical protein